MRALRPSAIGSLSGGVRGMRNVPNVINGATFMVDNSSDNFDPATGKVIAQIAASTKTDVEMAIEGAHDACGAVPHTLHCHTAHLPLVHY